MVVGRGGSGCGFQAGGAGRKQAIYVHLSTHCVEEVLTWMGNIHGHTQAEHRGVCARIPGYFSEFVPLGERGRILKEYHGEKEGDHHGKVSIKM